MNSVDKRLLRWSLLLGSLWSLTCLVGGAWLLGRSFASNHRLSEQLFPLYLGAWCAAFFAGRALLARFIRFTSGCQSIKTKARPITSTARVHSIHGVNVPHFVPFAWDESRSTILPVRGNFEIDRLNSGAVKLRQTIPARFVQNETPKIVWKGFRIPSASDKVLQGVFTSTDSLDISQLATNDALIQQILRYVFQTQVPSRERMDTSR